MKNLKEQLHKLALIKSKPFCMSCYELITTESGHCKFCGSDDSARITNNGLDWGASWIIDDLLSEELEIANLESSFEDMMSEVYPEETQVGFCTFNTSDLIKNHDPIAWKIALDEFIDSQVQDEIIFTNDNGSTYYWTKDVEQLVQDI